MDSDRYDVSGLEEAQVEPGSGGRVLKNLLGIKSKRLIDQVEAREQLRALDELVAIYDQGHRFTAKDICEIHRIWLGDIYAWAGKYRLVNLTKGAFPFAVARHIPKLMKDLENGPLHEYTPCNYNLHEKIAEALAVVHTELLLIHPFRDGNGRTARILAILMGLQADLPPLNFGGIKGKKRKNYFAAIQAGLDHNYGPMQEIFTGVIYKTLQFRER
jgi:cell filamentation protein